MLHIKCYKLKYYTSSYVCENQYWALLFLTNICCYCATRMWSSLTEVQTRKAALAAARITHKSLTKLSEFHCCMQDKTNIQIKYKIATCLIIVIEFNSFSTN